MKYKTEKTLRRAKKAFSLIELMIVIVIIGALTAIILPQFDISESEAKDAGCDASNYGTLSQLTKFRALHGAYPSNMHTGYEASAADTPSTSIMGTTSATFAAIPSFTALNMANGSSETARSTTIDINSSTYANCSQSLREAGIISLASGGFPVESDKAATAFIAFNGIMGESADSTNNTPADVVGVTVNLSAITSNWFEEWAIGSDGIANTAALNTSSTPISINGIPLPYYMCKDPRSAYSSLNGVLPVITTLTDSATADTDVDGIVVPLFLAPTTDWDHWYDANGGENDSKIQVAQVGQCPWLEGGVEFRYYIAIFKLYGDGSKAKLLGTMCPEGGSLNP